MASNKTYEIAFALNGKMNSSMKKTFNQANSMVSGLVKTAAGIGTALAGSVVARDIIGTFAGFEQAMANVSAVTGATGSELDNLEKLARDMGKSTTKSAKEAAEAISYMGLAGWDSTQIMQGIEPVLRLSESGMLDLGRTSDLVTDSLSSLGLQVEELPKYLDMVAQTSRKSNTNIDMLMEAMIVAGGTFKNLNVPLEESNALLGVLANRGKKGSEAGNSLNSILINLTSGAGQAGEAMEALGISAFDSDGNFKGVTETLLELNDKVVGLTEEQRTMYLSMIGGKTQIDTLQALLSGVTEEYGALENSIINSDGALNDMANTMNDTLSGSWKMFLSALEELKIQIGDSVGSELQNMINTMTTNLPQAFENAKTFMKGAFEAAQPTIAWMKDTGLPAIKTGIGFVVDVATELYNHISSNWSTIAPLIMGITAGFAAFKATLVIGGAAMKAYNIGVAAWKVVTDAQTLSQTALNLAMSVSPVTWLAVAIGALVAIGVLLWKNWDTVQAKAMELGEGIKQAFGGLCEWFSGIWDGVTAGFKGFLNFFIDGINFVVRALNKIQVDIPDFVPVVGGQTFGINIAEIPKFAKGTTGYNTPDTFIAGEEGPELVTKARGYKVFTNSETKRMGASSGGAPPVVINNNITLSGADAASKATVERALKEAERAWTKKLNEMLRGNSRLSFY